MSKSHYWYRSRMQQLLVVLRWGLEEVVFSLIAWDVLESHIFLFSFQHQLSMLLRHIGKVSIGLSHGESMRWLLHLHCNTQFLQQVQVKTKTLKFFRPKIYLPSSFVQVRCTLPLKDGEPRGCLTYTNFYSLKQDAKLGVIQYGVLVGSLVKL